MCAGPQVTLSPGLAFRFDAERLREHVTELAAVDREHDPPVASLERRLLEHLAKQCGNVLGRIFERPASQCAEHEIRHAIVGSDAHDRADLIAHAGDHGRMQHQFAVLHDGRGTVDRGNSDEIRLPRLLEQRIPIQLVSAEHRDAGAPDAAEVAVERILCLGPRQVILLCILRERIQCRVIIRAQEAGLLLCTAPGVYAAAGVLLVRQIEDGRHAGRLVLDPRKGPRCAGCTGGRCYAGGASPSRLTPVRIAWNWIKLSSPSAVLTSVSKMTPPVSLRDTCSTI